MNIRYYPFFLAAAAAIYITSTVSIITAKRAELRYLLHHATLLNYEVSGRTLTDKLWRRLTGVTDMEADARGAALERAIFADGSQIEKPNALEKLGVGISNVIRRIRGEAGMDFDRSIERLSALRQGFRAETRNNCAAAITLYTRAETEYDLTRDELSFTLVHRAYCYAMSGDFEKALADVRRVQTDLHDARHAGEADAIAALLESASAQVADLRARGGDDREIAAALFQRGDFRSVTALLGARRDLSAAESLMLAQAYEYAGDSASAVREYLKLVKRDDARETAVQANRRLLYISKYSGGGRRLEEFATERAKDLNDGQAVERIERITAAAAPQRSAATNDLTVSPAAEDKDAPDEREEAAEADPTGAAAAASIAAMVGNAQREIRAARSAGRLLISLTDGRQFDANIAYLEDGALRLLWGEETTYAPMLLVQKIERSDGRPLKITYMDESRAQAPRLQRASGGGFALAGANPNRRIRSIE